MTGINIADVIVLGSVIGITAVCIKTLTVGRKNGICSCGRTSCSGCSLCKAAQQYRH